MARLCPSWRATGTAGGLLILLLSLSPSLAGQAPSSEPRSRPSAAVPFVAEAGALKIDGELNEAAWGQARRLNQFRQVEPVQGGPADPPTEVWLMRDRKALYLAFVCLEPNPQGMVLQNMRRDAFLNDDDRMEWVLDTFRDGKTAFWFQISAAGSRGDALIGDNGRRFNKAWNGFWEGRTRRMADRWVAEIRIPFATLGFGDDPTWRANFERYRGSDRSNYRWASPQRALRVMNVTAAGELSGFEGLDQGLGLEFRPFLKGKYQDEVGDSDFLGDLGGELSWNLTPQLKASLTWNTDFAETEVDERRVNLTRFPLFFPEKRDFFLQDSNLFQFGEIGRFDGGGSNLVPFFSRRIGLSRGVEVPIDAGARLAGRAGSWDLGALAVHTGEAPSIGVPDGDLFVFRPSYRINREMAVGGLLTSGNPEADSDNTVVGGDFRWGSTRLFPGQFGWNNFIVQSQDEASSSKGLGFGSQATLRTANWRYEASILGTQGDFMPAIGFVRRPGEMQSAGTIEFAPRPEQGPVRVYRFTLSPSMWTDLGGDTISSQVDLTAVDVEWNSGDRLRLGARLESDRPDIAFPVSPTVGILPGDYSWTRWVARLNTSDNRPLAFSTTLTFGSWYDGDLTQVRTDLDWRPNQFFSGKAEYNEDRGSLPGGDFAIRIERLSLDFSLTPDLSLESLLQADNLSDTLGLQARLRWLVEDGRELFLVVDSGWQEMASGAIVPTGSDVTVKVVYAVRI